nr:uncharacterized protein LOC107455501 [Parasteatoda tepidariorum]
MKPSVKTSMYMTIFLVLAISQLSSAAECDPSVCGIRDSRINCNRGYRAVFATCSCCLTCERVLQQGEQCEVRRSQYEVLRGGVVYENFTYPHCAQGLYCSYSRTCQRRNF